MPAVFESTKIKFLYPDNWKVQPRSEDENLDGVTLELPSGGFFSLEREVEGQLEEELIEEVADSFAQDYGEIEREEIELEGGGARERVVDFRFYYLDLVVVSRLVILEVDGVNYVVQFQAESRDFDSNAMVFSAIMKQIRG